MNLQALDIPEDPAQLPAWIERQLTGFDLARLVAELTAVHGAAQGSTPDLDDVLGKHKWLILTQGLGVLPADRLREFLRHPRLLLDLQELVFREGGAYWSETAPDAEHGSRIERGAGRLQTFLAGQEPRAAVTTPLRPRRRWYQRSWAASLATAAALLAAFAAYEHLRPQPAPIIERLPPDAVAWGWNKPAAMANDATPAAYLNQLADEAGEWFHKRPTEAAELAQRISEFREGCSRLIFAAHRPLPPQERQWLVENCRTWGRKLDKKLVALESGQNVLEVRDETDALIQELMGALREQAKKLT
jgi:hypothetical protein